MSNITIIRLAIVLCIVLGCWMSLQMGYMIGKDQGIKITLDTVNSMLDKQVKSDTTVTALFLELERKKKDTVCYFISRRSVLNK